ncbi:ubiquitin carboxyl-terminal hydrolase 22/27/51 [Nematocida sp. LUAm3]|nr:ubiquitin carboxyl-terminal hydrolase 22/27/51 [Nematocida sp. LUAm3]KAI5173742.1 ubiquitin carboxyl-terminal hydrolase 22/27/51 [Nematocida sp. LUAm2]KAI5176965.1 ubiquitin carboxyl-terminal hydrolase 22/27/51 [Nematocida sp. LUAm1]
MSCTHLDIEAVIERLSGVIYQVEKAEKQEKQIVCSICGENTTVEICTECNTSFCRSKGHVHEHWKNTWHKNFLFYGASVISCEECVGYYKISELSKMIEEQDQVIPIGFEPLNMNWVKGFLNLKRTCYMSSLLQSLLSNQYFLSSFLSFPHSVIKCTNEQCILCALNRIVYQMYSSTDGYVDISSLIWIFWKNSPTFAKSEYQDVQECFIYLGQQIHSACLQNGSSPCPFHEIFGGTFSSSLSCKNCSNSKVSEEKFTSISIDLLEPTLEKGIDLYLRSESISLEKLCECGNSRGYTKFLEIKKYPHVLCIHLKRYEIKNNAISKIERLIKYPETLFLEDKKYELGSVIAHSGEIDSGHYISYIQRNAQWYLTNDEEIVRVSKVDVLDKSTAYILLYSLTQ